MFESWDNRRAQDYRRLNGIPYELGTAVNVQQMVFGNTGERSGTGVAFTRNNTTGESGKPFGDFLINAQGEDVVAGIRTPRPLEELGADLPEAYAQLMETMALLERTYRDMQDVEFTIEDGKLYMLQTRNGKRSAQAMVRIAVELVDEGLRTEQESLRDLIDPSQVRQLLLPQLDVGRADAPVATGRQRLAGSRGRRGGVRGRRGRAPGLGQGEQVILVRDETTPDDLHGMIMAQGVLTARGGKTSHAAIVAVGMGKPAVCGVSTLDIDVQHAVLRVGGHSIAEGEVITIDGTGGRVLRGAAAAGRPGPGQPLPDAHPGVGRRRPRGSGSAPTRTPPRTPSWPAEFGAEGIGLCRTEHMFQAADRVPIVQAMIMAEDAEERREHLAQAAAHPGGRLRGHLPRHARPAGDHPAAGPAAPRVPAEPGGPLRRGRPRPDPRGPRR